MAAQQLPRLSRADLTRLTTPRILPNLIKIPLYLGLMIGAGVLTWTTDSAIVDWTMYVLLGYLWMSIVTFMHDATHHTLFHRRWLNAAFGIVAMIPVGVSFVAFRKDHLEHHRHNRSPRDPDAFTMGRRGAGDMVLFYAYMVAGALLSFLHFNVLYPIRSLERREWGMHLFETALKVAAGLTLVYWALANDTLGKTLALWLIPIFIFSLFNSMRFIAEHCKPLECEYVLIRSLGGDPSISDILLPKQPLIVEECAHTVPKWCGKSRREVSKTPIPPE